MTLTQQRIALSLLSGISLLLLIRNGLITPAAYIHPVFSAAMYLVFFSILGLGVAGLIKTLDLLYLRRKWSFVRVFLISFSILALGNALYGEIERYKPTRIIEVPPGFVGEVTAFRSRLPEDLFQFGGQGICYLSETTWYKSHLKIVKDGEDITKTLDLSGSSEILVYAPDSSYFNVYQFFCFDVLEKGPYPDRPYAYGNRPCNMNSSLFLKLCAEGSIDSTRLWRHRFKNE